MLLTGLPIVLCNGWRCFGGAQFGTVSVQKLDACHRGAQFSFEFAFSNLHLYTIHRSVHFQIAATFSGPPTRSPNQGDTLVLTMPTAALLDGVGVTLSVFYLPHRSVKY